MKPLDFVGKRFGRLTVVSRVANNTHGSTRWHCVCDCGEGRDVLGGNLQKGRTTSCGCGRVGNGNLGVTKHGHCSRAYGGDSKEYRAWRGMLSRCCRKSHPSFAAYGGRGISVCERWASSFSDFLADVGSSPSSSHSLDRIDVDGDYAPGNVRWATAKEQANNRRSNHPITAYGATHTIQQWADKVGVPDATIRGRLRRGWQIERAISIKAGEWYRLDTAGRFVRVDDGGAS